MVLREAAILMVVLLSGGRMGMDGTHRRREMEWVKGCDGPRLGPREGWEGCSRSYLACKYLERR
jgi:hypothetical protein